MAAGGRKQPYHEAEAMPFDEATAHIEGCATATAAAAEKSLRDAIAKISEYDLNGACILAASGRRLPDVATILRSHALIHAAEGEFFRSAIRQACQCCGLAHTQVKENDVWREASRVLGRDENDLRRVVDALGKGMGPPWQQDQKLAAIAAWLTLARSV